jgi:pyruvate formate lyase activating enzyme
MTKNHNPEKGLIFNIQRFSIHDGPGIRTTIFMKGCPLRCRWCSNPESQDFSPNLMARDINCRACGACVEACPEGAIILDREQGRRIHWEECTQCLECVNACVYDSLRQCGNEMTVEEVLDEVLRDEAFYRNSGGGMTVSGGEALSQGEFVADLLGAAKDAGLHTALDTTGYAPWEKLERTIPFVDLILWDIKHLDSREHKWGTGLENEVILENLKRASGLSKAIWLRMPLIKDFNDSEAHIRKVIALGKEIGAEKISLLPYHEGGKTKCEQMGRVYPFPEGESPTDEEIEQLKGIIENEGLKVSIGS